MALAPLPHKRHRFRSIDTSPAKALVDTRQSRVDSTAVSDVESRLVRSNAATSEVCGDLGSLTIAHTNPLDYEGIITAEAIQSRFSPALVKLRGLLHFPGEVTTGRRIEMVWPLRNDDFVEQHLKYWWAPLRALLLAFCFRLSFGLR